MNNKKLFPSSFEIKIFGDSNKFGFSISKKKSWSPFDSRQLAFWLSASIGTAAAVGLAFVFWPAAIGMGVIALGLLISAIVDVALHNKKEKRSAVQEAEQEALEADRTNGTEEKPDPQEKIVTDTTNAFLTHFGIRRSGPASVTVEQAPMAANEEDRHASLSATSVPRAL